MQTMKVTIKSGKPCGTVTAPPSKSMAHRLLISAALATGDSKVRGLEMSDDITATLGCLRALGADIKMNGDTACVSGGLCKNACILDCNESGSTLRFMIPICLSLNKKITLRGTKRLFSRSLSVYEKLCADNGMYFEKGEDFVTVKGDIKSGVYRVRGDISSQFISGLMFILPTLEGDSVIEIEGKLESAPYLDLTEAALRDFGVTVTRTESKIAIKGAQRYQPRDIRVEGDESNAAFFDALTLMGGDVRVTGLSPKTLQGDRVYKEYFEKIKRGETLDISDCPDLGPIMMAVGAAYGGVKLTGTHRLKIKESDRGAAMAAELEKFGITVQNGDNDIAVSGKLTPPKDFLYGHNDHRIVMSLATLCVKTGGVIDGAEAVRKSLPDYFERLSGLGLEVRYETE